MRPDGQGCVLLVFGNGSPDIVQRLREQADVALKTMELIRSRGQQVAGMDRMAAGLRRAVADKRLAWLRRALSSHVVRKCEPLRNQCP